MRLRNNPHANEIIAAHDEFCIINPQTKAFKIASCFENEAPLYIEIGMGKGDFIYENAKRNPEINYLGIEKYPSILAIAAKKIAQLGSLPNLKLICFDAANLAELFKPHQISKIYLNFSDPWPKKRHAKRRLTHANFLKVYQEILAPNGEIEFKSDNRSLIEYSIISFNKYPLDIVAISLDLHADNDQDNIMTEYERKFSPHGPIYKIVAKFK